MPHTFFGPSQIGGRDPEEEQEVPFSFDLPIFSNAGQGVRGARTSGSLFALQTTRAASSLTRALVGTPEIPQAAPVLPEGPVETGEVRGLENFGIAIQEAKEVAGVLFGTTAQLAGQAGGAIFGDDPVSGMTQAPEFLQALQEYGTALRRESGADLARLAQREPARFRDEVLRLTIGTLPIVAAAAAGGLAGGVTAGAVGVGAVGAGLIGAFTAAFGAAFPTEKGLIQNELEAAGLTAEQADLWSSGVAVPIAIAEAAFPTSLASGLVGKVLGGGARRTLVGSIVNIVKKAGVGVIEEGITEAVQQGIQIAGVAKATGEDFDPQEAFSQVLAAGRGGGIVGAVLGGTFGFTGEMIDHTMAAAEDAEQREAFVAAANFDPKEAPVGTRVLGKVKTEDSLGRERWVLIDPETGEPQGNRLTKAPTSDELKDAVLSQSKDARVEAETEQTLTDVEPADVPIESAAVQVAELVGREIDPSVVEQNVRLLAIGYTPKIGAQIRSMTESEITSELAQLEAIALDPSSKTSYAGRLTALGRKRAIERHLRRAKAGKGIEALDVTRGARGLARLDETRFEEIATSIESGQNQIQERLLKEARRIRASSEELVTSETDEINKLRAKGATRRQRGLAIGSEIVTRDGNAGVVKEVRDSGFVEVEMEDDTRVILDPGEVDIIPQVDRNAQLVGGQVVKVKQITDNKVRVELPNGSETLVELSEIESLEASSASKPVLAEKALEQKAEAGAEVRTALPTPIEGVDSRSGKPVQIVEIGGETLLLDDGSTIKAEDVSFPAASNLVSEITSAEQIPIFQPGTQPSGEGRHINFLQLSDTYVPQFESAVEDNNSGVISTILKEAAPRGGGFFLYPQGPKPGTVLYAIELPASNRTLTNASKRALGFLGGKGSVSPQTLKARVHLKGNVTPETLGVMKVPEGLRAVVSGTGFGHLPESSQREYLRRLTDLGFDMSPEIAEALTATSDAAQEAADARIAGRIGAAEMAEINVQTKHMEAAQAAIEQDIDERLEIWDAADAALRDVMTPRELSVIETLNETLLDDLLRIPGVGKPLADKIVAARKQQGGAFETIEDLLEIRGIGPETFTGIRNAIQEGEINLNDRIGAIREAALKKIFKEFPGRVGRAEGRQYAFAHPTIPGFTLIIDKETVSGVTDVGRFTDEERLTLGFSEAELAELESRAELGTRDVFHIKFVTPEGREIVSRTIGTDLDSTIEVPEHLALARVNNLGLAETPPAIERLTLAAREDLEEGESFDLGKVVEDMRSERRRTQRVLALGPQGRQQEFTLIEDDGGTAMVQDEGGERFTIDSRSITKELGTVDEPMVTVSAPRRLSESEILDEVVRQTREFRNDGANLLTLGTWHSQIPGVYADIRANATGGTDVMMFQEAQTRQQKNLRTFDPRHFKTFSTREEAETYLGNRDFARVQPRHQVGELFESLPSIGDLTRPPPGPVLDALSPQPIHDMIRTEGALTHILDFYNGHGYIPKPVREYAQRFAMRWNQMALRRPGGLFGRKDLRNNIGVFEVRDAQEAAGARREASIVRPDVPDMIVEDGNVVVQRRTASQIADDVRVLDGFLISPSVEATHPARMEMVKKVQENKELNDLYLDMAVEDGVPAASVSRVYDRLVEILSTGKLGVVIDSKFGSAEMVVQTFEGGEASISRIAKNDTRRVRNANKALDFYRAARDGMQEMRNIPRTPGIGVSPYDENLGLKSIQTEEAYTDGLRAKVAETVKDINLAEDGSHTATPEQIAILRNAWIRMKELGISNDPEIMPPQLVMLVKNKAYEELSNTFSNISPYGDIVAKAKLGLLTVHQETEMAKQAKEFGIDPDLPLYRKVEELVQNAWDPSTAHLMYQTRNTIGALMFTEDGGVPELGLELRPLPMGSSIQTGKAWLPFTMPKELANRHPTFKIFHYLAEKARTLHGNTIKRVVDTVRGLQSLSDMTLERKETVWDLLQDETLGDVMERPADVLEREQVEEAVGEKYGSRLTDWDWYSQYRTMRNLSVEANYQHIWNSLVRGFNPQEIVFKDDSTAEEKVAFMETVAKDNNMPEAEADKLRELVLGGHKVYNLERTSNPAYAKPRSEAKAFIELLKNYRSFESIPEDTREMMRQTEESWMSDEFDFWARFGINNYAPRILQGRHKILMKTAEGLEDKIVAFAPDGQTFYDFAFRVDRGKIPGVPSGSELYLEPGKAIADENDMEFLGPTRFARMYARLVSKYKGDKGEAAKFMQSAVRELRVGSEKAAPRDIHMEARVADLSDVIEDPYQRMIIYWARTSRNNFLLELEDSFSTARELDASLSRAEGLEGIFKGNGEQGNEAVRKYMEDLRNDYMGLPTSVEKVMNRLIAWGTSPVRLSRKALGEIRKKLKNEDYDLWSDPTFLNSLYNEDYAARKWAESLTMIQSMFRLGFNLSGAMVNSMQHMMFTPTFLMLRGATTKQAIGFAIGGRLDSIKYWGAANEETRDELSEFATDVGIAVSPSRGAGGPGLGVTGESKPIFYSDDGPIEKLGKMTEWIAMMPFAGAERSVRLASAFAARRFAMSQGMSREASVDVARDVIDNTQFQYYDQALPPVLRNPLARVVMQFKPFMFNALKFEKDLLLASLETKGPLSLGFVRAGKLRRQSRMIQPATGKEIAVNAQARKAMMLYNATGALWGGGAWFVGRPFLAGPYAWLSQLWGGQGLEEMLANAFGGEEERKGRTFGTTVAAPEFFSGRNAALYGLPGLLNLQLSARLGVSGLDLDPTRFWDMAIGPTGAMYADAAKLFFSEGGFVHKNPKATFLGLGAAGLSQLSGSARRGQGFRYPLSLIGNALVATELASLREGTPLHRFMDTNTAGRRFIDGVSPRIIKGIARTIDIFDMAPLSGDFTPSFEGNPVFDANFQQRRYPGAINKLFESAAAIAGFQTIGSAEERALLRAGHLEQETYSRRRAVAIEEAASVVLKGAAIDSEAIVSIQAYALETLGVEVSLDDIQEALAERGMSASEKANNQLNRLLRGSRR